MSIKPISASRSFEESDTQQKQVLKRAASMGAPIEQAHYSVTFTPDEEAMVKRVRRAARERRLDPNQMPLLPPCRVLNSVHLTWTTCSRTGKRIINEDHHIITETTHGTLFAICDGHGLINHLEIKKNIPQPGQTIAKLVTESVEKKLMPIIHECHFNTNKAFRKWAVEVQEGLPEIAGGTTAAIGFFEKINHYFHVATFGDTEFVVFRKHEGAIHPIPMSARDNWASSTNVARVKEILTPHEFHEWEKQSAKNRRFPPKTGVNVACALGNKLNTYNNQTAISHEPHCSMLQLKEGDIVMGACDGVFDFARLSELIEHVIEPHWDNHEISLADAIANYVLNQKNSTDNVTVISIRVHREPQQLQESTHPSTPLLPLEEN